MSIYRQILSDIAGRDVTDLEMENLLQQHRKEVREWLAENYPDKDTGGVAIADGAYVRDAKSECAACPGITTCPRHGMIPKLVFGEQMYPYIAMAECDKLKQHQWENRLEKMLQQAMLPSPLRKQGFANFDTSHSDNKRAYEAAKNAYKTGKSLVLASGANGNGKTHLAAAIINCVIRKGKTGLFVSVPEMVESLRIDAFRRDQEGKSRTMDLLFKADVLVLDDMGKERMTDFVGERLFSLIDNRYLHGKQLIITTNSETPEELVYRMGLPGKAITSRLQEMCGVSGWVVIASPDYRPRKGAVR